MLKPALPTGVCQIEEIFDDESDAPCAQSAAPQPSTGVESPDSPTCQPSTHQPVPAELSGSLSDDGVEFHDASEAVHSHVGGTQVPVLSDLSDEEHDAEAFQDAHESAPASEVTASGAKPPQQQSGSPGERKLMQAEQPSAHDISRVEEASTGAVAGDTLQATLPPTSAATASSAAPASSPATSGSVPASVQAPAVMHAVAEGFGQLPSPGPARRVRDPHVGPRPYPPHAAPANGGETVATLASGLPVEEQAVHRAYKVEGEEDVPLGSLPVAGAPEMPKYSAEELQASVEAAEVLKQEGNALYAAGDMEAATVRFVPDIVPNSNAKYGAALDAALEGAQQRAVYFANRAACQLKLKEWAPAAADCTRALEIYPGYLKALARRCVAYEALDDMDRALADAQKVVELDPADVAMKKTVKRLEPIVEVRREKMKDEMMGKLKDLGNTVLGKFGLSLDNFKAEKDPATGSYSIQFNQS